MASNYVESKLYLPKYDRNMPKKPSKSTSKSPKKDNFETKFRLGAKLN